MVATVTLAVHIVDPTLNTPAVGGVCVSVPVVLRDTVGDRIIGPGPIRATLVNGQASIVIPDPYDPDVSPSGWSPHVEVRTNVWTGGFDVVIPEGAPGRTVQLADLAPAVSPPALLAYALASELAELTAELAELVAELAGYVPLIGGTLTGALSWSGTPTTANHLTPRGWVEQHVDQALADVGGGGLDETALEPLARKPIVRDAYVKTGNVDPIPNTSGSWAELPGFELELPALVGDEVALFMHGMRNSTETAYLTAAVKVGDTRVRYLSSGTDQPAVEGDTGWYPGQYTAQSGPRGFTVEAGHLDGGVVRFVLVCKGNGAGVLYASEAFPFYWRAVNSGPGGEIA